MRKFVYILMVVAIGLFTAQCSDWVTAEPNYKEPVNINGDDYYEALRAYKKSDHSIMFGWYSGWTGIGIDMNNQLCGVPDSMDVISLWENSDNLTEAQLSDLKEVREKKGTRVITCTIITNMGDGFTPKEVNEDCMVDGVKYDSWQEARAAYWGWYGEYGDTSQEGIEKAIRKYANAIVDFVNKYNYDGFDIDFEPNFDGVDGNMNEHNDRMHILIEELGKHFGPKSGTGRLLVVDGEPQTLNTETGAYLDYYIVQAYNCDGDADLDDRFQKLLNKFGSIESEATILSKTIWCENFEGTGASTGGPEFTTRSGEVYPYSLIGMGLYSREGVKAHVGGCGAYRFNLCRPMDDYLKMRHVIQLMNPAIH